MSRKTGDFADGLQDGGRGLSEKMDHPTPGAPAADLGGTQSQRKAPPRPLPFREGARTAGVPPTCGGTANELPRARLPILFH